MRPIKYLQRVYEVDNKDQKKLIQGSNQSFSKRIDETFTLIEQLKTQLETLKKDTEKSVDKGIEEIKETKTITYVGFLVLLVMVATLVATVGVIIIDNFRFEGSGYSDLGNKVSELRDEIHRQKGFR